MAVSGIMGWDELVHEAFFSLFMASDDVTMSGFRMSESTLPGEVAWAAIDLYLDKWGALAALALERTVDEAQLLLDGEPDAERVRVGRSHIEQARERLARFYRAEATFAA
jgi:hypothetical protein